MASEVERDGVPALPQEMERHTYAIMYEVEGSHWWFAGRRRILESFVKEIVANLNLHGRQPRILDVGCGTGANLEMLAQFGAAEGVDVSEDALAFCRARGLNAVTLGAAERLPYADASFDLVTALDVVEHLDDDLGGLREMWRVLRPGGRARCCRVRWSGTPMRSCPMSKARTGGSPVGGASLRISSAVSSLI